MPLNPGGPDITVPAGHVVFPIVLYGTTIGHISPAIIMGKGVSMVMIADLADLGMESHAKGWVEFAGRLLAGPPPGRIQDIYSARDARGKELRGGI